MALASGTNMIIERPLIRRKHVHDVMERTDAVAEYDTDKSGGLVFRCMEWQCEGKPGHSHHSHSQRPYLVWRGRKGQ